MYRLSGSFLFFIGIALFWLAAAYIELDDNFKDLKKSLSSNNNLIEGDASSKLLDILDQLDSNFILSRSIENKNLRKEHVTSKLLAFSKDAKQPIVNININEHDFMHSESGIVDNAKNRGEEWEKKALLQWYEGGDILHSSTIGLRIHGTQSRKNCPTTLICNYRIYYRAKYRSDIPDSKLLFPSQQNIGKLSSLVLSNTTRESEPHTVLFASSIARSLGLYIPPLRRVTLYINGVLQKVDYYITEYPEKEHWQDYFQHNNFAWYKERGALSKDKRLLRYEQLRKKINDIPEGMMSIERLRPFINIDNLMNIFIFNAYCGNYDWSQDIAIYNMRSIDSKWFWVPWDIEECFSSGAEDSIYKDWRQDGFKVFLFQKNYLKGVIFSRLISESPNFISLLKSYFEKAKLSALNEDRLLERIEQYEKEQNISLVKLRDFIKNRNNYLKKELSLL